ncbi:hypothetical protein EB151_09410, partial [archaeon]|nr:hypothetical protein [archaeon]
MFYTLIKQSLSPQDLICVLNNFQQDLRLIVAKHRYANHILSTNEILSEVNNYVIRYINTLSLKNFGNVTEFKKFLYQLSKKFILWTKEGGREPKVISYNRRKEDRCIQTEDGPQTIFDYICLKSGKKDDFHIRSNKFNKYKNIYRWIFDYSHFLTQKQKEILKMYWSGSTVEKIGEHFNISHQGASHIIRESIPKIRQYIKIPNTNIENHIVEGNKSIKNL